MIFSNQQIEHVVKAVDSDLQLEADFRLSTRQRAQLVLDRRVTISYLTFRPFARRVHHYLAITSEDDRAWGCTQDLSSLDYTIYLL